MRMRGSWVRSDVKNLHFIEWKIHNTLKRVEPFVIITTIKRRIKIDGFHCFLIFYFTKKQWKICTIQALESFFFNVLPFCFWMKSSGHLASYSNVGCVDPPHPYPPIDPPMRVELLEKLSKLKVMPSGRHCQAVTGRRVSHLPLVKFDLTCIAFSFMLLVIVKLYPMMKNNLLTFRASKLAWKEMKIGVFWLFDVDQAARGQMYFTSGVKILSQWVLQTMKTGSSQPDNHWE